MAYFDRRRDKEVTVYYYDKQLKRAAPLPRSETEHLDGKSDIEVQRWIEEWEASSGKGRQRSRRRAILGIDDVVALVDAHIEDHRLKSDPPLREDTLEDYKRNFDRYILPYFVTEHACKDVRKWHALTDQFPTYLIVKYGMPGSSARKICQTLLRFGRFLVRRHVLVQPWLIDLPRNRNRRKPPLGHKLTPDEVLAAARKLTNLNKSQWALCLLIGYFGSLRPEELFALEKRDFLYSVDARTRAKTWQPFQKYKLGSGLSVIIDRTIIKKEPENLTKTHYSRGVVNVFSSEGAKAIAVLLKPLEEGRLFPGARWVCNSAFYKHVKAMQEIGLNPSDLRRASANYLGKKKGVDPYTLQDHLRHAEMSTTMLYCRDPAERDQDESGAPNYDDVG